MSDRRKISFATIKYRIGYIPDSHKIYERNFVASMLVEINTAVKVFYNDDLQ